jgi:hypothetical protein
MIRLTWWENIGPFFELTSFYRLLLKISLVPLNALIMIDLKFLGGGDLLS